MSEIPTNQLTRARLDVPILGFGTAPLGTAPAWGRGEPISETQASATLRYAIDYGVHFFDTAPSYANGLVETRVGRVLELLPRNKLIIETKVGVDISDAETRYDYSRDSVLRSLEGSLKRLRIDRVDILAIHDPDDHYRAALDEAFPTLADLRAQGVIRAIGVGMNQWQMLTDFARDADFDCFLLAGRYTLIEQGALPLLDLCAHKGITIFAASIYNSGILATGAIANARYNHTIAPAHILDRVRAIEALCRSFDVPLHAAATQFPFGHPAVKSIIVGFQTPAEVQACLSALERPIPPELWARLRDGGLVSPEAPTPPVSFQTT